MKALNPLHPEPTLLKTLGNPGGKPRPLLTMTLDQKVSGKTLKRRVVDVTIVLRVHLLKQTNARVYHVVNGL